MRFIVITEQPTWPMTTGTRYRIGAVIDALSKLGEVDVFSMVASNDIDTAERFRHPKARRVRIVPRPAPRSSFAQRVSWLLTGSLPLRFLGRNYDDVREAFREWREARYDLAWMSRAETYVALGDDVPEPMIVDLDDLEDRKILGAVDVWRGTGASPVGVAMPLEHIAGARVGTWLAQIDARRWSRLQRTIARDHLAVVCSSLDARRLGHAAVIENAMPDRARRDRVSEGSVVLFYGELTYPPNVDAAVHLVRDVAPIVWERHPCVEVRLVGRDDPRVHALEDSPMVTVTGFVEDILSELDLATIVAVPIRFGSGTRLKIIEAMAAGVPVVSTSIGAEGLDVEPGRHLLVADGASDFAGACTELLENSVLRRELASAGRALFLERYEWGRIVPRIQALVRAVVAGGT